MRWVNTKDHYGIVAMVLHWLLAVLIIGMLGLGLYMVTLPIGHQKLQWYGWHKEFGFLVLALVMVRFFWRIVNTTPQLTIPRLEKMAARSVHGLFYVLMFAMPITGWLMTSAAGLPVSFFGLFVMPVIAPPSDELRHLFREMHEWIAYGLIAVIGLHVLAAFKHYFIDKDDILQRMIS